MLKAIMWKLLFVFFVFLRLAKCIDQYISERQEGSSKIDPRLEDVVQSMFNKCYSDNESEQVSGVISHSKGYRNSFRVL